MSIDQASRAVPATLAGVIERLQTHPELPVKRRQDLVSAVRLICRALGRNPTDTPVEATLLRRQLTSVAAVGVGVSPGRWRNALSLFNKALVAVGVARNSRRSSEPMSASWAKLLKAVNDRYLKTKLTRLAGFCTTKFIEPDQLDDAIVDTFGRQLRSDGLVPRPKQVHRNACVAWNEGVDTIAGWPQRRLVVPAPVTRPRWRIIPAPAGNTLSAQT